MRFDCCGGVLISPITYWRHRLLSLCLSLSLMAPLSISYLHTTVMMTATARTTSCVGDNNMAMATEVIRGEGRRALVALRA